MGCRLFFFILCLTCIGFVNSYNSVIENQLRQEYVRRQGVRGKIDQLGDLLKKRVQLLRDAINQEVELVFLVDSSSSVGLENFFNELKFVKKLLADFTVTSWATRVAVITFSSKYRVKVQIDHISQPNSTLHKCSLMNEEMPKIEYVGGGTYTKGAFQKAQMVLRSARHNSTKAVFLITDGYSNSGDPRPYAEALRRQGVSVFTFGIHNGNVNELRDMASEPKAEHCYILDSFEEFEALARRALHEDLGVGSLIEQDLRHCSSLCSAQESCCDSIARCVCGIRTGQYQCMCSAGYYGNGLRGSCQPCPSGTYKPTASVGGITTCLTCPDSNHISPQASTSLHQCVCKDGFSKIDSDTRCKEIACESLIPPEQGYFVGGSCSNTFNSACGIRCQAGYEMRGSSIRLCEEDGTWSGEEPYCRLKLCMPLDAPKFGQVRCDRRDYAFRTTCTSSCWSGYQLIGTRRRECLAIGEWSGLPAACREITCQALPEVENGEIDPPHCTSRKATVQQVCLISCKRGYKRSGPRKYQCQIDGQWTDSKRETECLDVEPPDVTCPMYLVTETDLNSNVAEVDWKVPQGEDNSDDPVAITVVPAVTPPHRFPIGVHNVSYTAVDKSGNRGHCSFLVIVRDEEPPVIDRCRSPPPILSPEPMTFVDWEQPTFSDNSNEPVTVDQTHHPGLFTWGTTVVEYKASDSSGNSRTCRIVIQVQESLCEIPQEPLHGNTVCSPADSGISCSLECNDGYGFAITPNNGYYCDSDGSWYPPQNDSPWPDCSGERTASNAVNALTVTYRTVTRHCNVTFLDKISDVFRQQIVQEISTACTNGVVCELENVTAHCKESEETIDANELLKEVDNNLSKRKRDLRRGDVNPEDDEDEDTKINHRRGDVGPPEDIKEADRKINSRRGDVDEDNTESILVDVVVRGKVDLTESQNVIEDEERQRVLLDELQKIPVVLKNEATAGNLDIYLEQVNMTTKENDVRTTKTEPVCLPGTVLQGSKCVNCAVGTFYNATLNKCQECPVGTFQDEEASLLCKPCPPDTSTEHSRSKSHDLCYSFCNPGTFSSTGLEQCEGCELGYYQPSSGSKICLSCPHGTTTAKTATTMQEECKEPCGSGYVSVTGVAPCYPCPRGYYQPSTGQVVCFQCPDYADTDTIGASSQAQCEGVDEIDNKIHGVPLDYNDCFTQPCQNDGDCRPLSAGYLCKCLPGYTGVHCETETDECESNPCLNNATCIDQVNSFLCNCPPGFSGATCEENVDECRSSPCQHGGTCIDDINAYQCICIFGFRGTSCEFEKNECESNPCQNGMCLDKIGQYECDCIHGYSGRNCEINTDECASDPCQNNAFCKDQVDGFSCECIKGYEGEYCEVDINECASSPCNGAAMCLDLVGVYECVCPPAFSGLHCENELPSNFSMVFEFSGTVDFVEMNSMPNMTEFTISFWMKTADRDNYGTVLSYAVNDHSDNTLVITDYSGFVLYVNGDSRVTDATAKDNLWHHIAATWTSTSGKWSIYKDGRLIVSGEGLANNNIIPGDGVLILGQEQDAYGGGFSAPQSFVGELSLLNIWDRVLSGQEVLDVMYSCLDYHGTVKAWPDFLAGIQGRVYTKSNDFCQGCQFPEFSSNGKYTGGTPGTHAAPSTEINYQCDPGFDLIGAFSSTCQIHGRWLPDETSCVVKTCGFPGTLPNGQKIGSSYTYGDLVSWKCDAGFTLVGNAEITCTIDGTWSGTRPVCEVIQCGDLPQVPHATVTTGTVSRAHGARVIYNCDDGYELDGNAIVRCEMNARWSEIPSCEPVDCGPPRRVDHSVASASAYTYRMSITYTCDKGYEMRGVPERTCESDGRWSGSPPVCETVGCGLPHSVQHGDVSANDHTYQSVAEYWCDDGYILQGSKTAECTENGNWTTAPLCEEVNCGVLGNPANGQVSVIGLTLGHEALYDCYYGYNLIGIPVRTCSTDGLWSGEEPRCEPARCGQPNSIPNGKHRGSVYHYGSTVTFTCDTGYNMVGNASATCQANSEWTGFPSCNPVDCGQPDPVQNAEVNMTGHTYGHLAFYHCHVGSQLSGLPSRICQEDGQWSHDPPECVPISCGQPPDVDHGDKTGHSYIYPSIVTYTCDRGFDLIGSSEIACQLDAQWTSSPVCEPLDCGLPPSVEYATMLGESTKFDSHLYFTCEEGFDSTDNMLVQCRDTGRWSTEPTCLPVSCGPPWTVPNSVSTSTGDTYRYNSTVEYTCEQGYQLVGSGVHVCQANRMWSGNPPVCEIIRCRSPANVEHSKYTGEKVTFDSSLQYDCLSGYDLHGSATVTCQADGTWTEFPSCVSVDCGALSSINNGNVDADAFTYGSVARYGCDVGYQLEGTSELRCLADGKWSDQPPVCTKISCGLPRHVENSEHTGSSFFYGNKVHYTCDEGYELYGNDTIECLVTGAWTGVPQCNKVVCGEPVKLENGIRQFTGTEYGDMVSYSCDIGFQMVGVPLRHCTASGKWGGKLPICEIVSCGEPLTIAHGVYTVQSHVYGSVADYSCDVGYDLSTEDPVRCQDTGNWSDVPRCLPKVCTRPAAMPNRIAIVSGLTYGENITYDCAAGYRLRGSKHIKCQSDASWSDAAPECDIVNCGPPVDVHHATVSGTKYEYQSTAKFKCHPGYKMLGNSSVICQASGKWTARPVCSPVSCGPPPGIQNGVFHGEGYVFNQSVQYSCDSGYTLRGHAKMVCQEDARWSGESPHCDIVSCGERPDVAHASMHGDEVTFRSVVRYRCDPGYRLSGNETIICPADGIWTRRPSCNPVDCGQPDDVPNSIKSVSETTFGSLVSYNCDDGYIPVGDLDRICQDDGSWSGNSPICQIVTCNKALSLKHASHNGSSSHFFGDVIYYTCDRGYESSGNAFVQCQDTGKWTDLPVCGPVSCGRPETILSGRVHFSGETFKHNATYTCDTGYQLRGISARSCQADRSWSDDAPVCEIISCGRPPEVIHSTYDDSSGHVYGSVSVYKCSTGYNSIGNVSVTCKENGQWTAPPVCTPVSCNQPEIVEHAFVTSPGNSFRQKILFQCEQGYQLIGDNERECLASGRWSGSAPQCQLISCELPHTIVNGDYFGEEFTFGSSVTYECHEGYELRGLKTVHCLENGLWTQEPTCTPVLCEALDEIQHANAVFSGHTYGHTVSYTCERGYTLTGDTERICQSDGTWSEVPPVCDIVTCGRPDSVQFAARKENGNTYGSIVRYHCMPGYELRGESTVRCQASGSWGLPPTCVPVTCRQLRDIPHGSVTLPGVTFGTTAVYECETGYRLRGSQERTCQANRGWSGSLPVCQQISCGTPGDVLHATFSGHEFTYGSSVFYTCDTGYDMVGDRSIECLVTGEWTQAPACMLISCGPPLSTSKEIIIGSDFSYGQVVEIDCILGFEVEGEEYILCQANGEWSSIPKCVPVNCGEPKDVPHATVSGSQFRYGNRVYYVCNDGYELIGSDLMECQASGEWTAPPTCEPITCGMPPPLAHATFSTTGYSYTDILTYHCDVGYRIDGPDQRECEASGQWNGDAPQCLLISCGPPKKISHATLLYTDYTYNSVARYSCQPGHELVGSDQVICSSSGQWTPESPECKIVNCAPPHAIANGQVRGTNYSQSSVITYRCDTGYKLIGVGSQTCLLNKTWSYKQPTCELIKCKAPDGIANGRIIEDDYYFDSTIEYVCDSGYELSGPRTRSCQTDSTWSGATSVCREVRCGAPPTVDNGHHFLQHRDDYIFGSRVQYICNIGYIMSSDGGLVCTANGSWQGNVPSCDRKSCGQPAAPPEGFILSGTFLYSDILEYACLPGFNMIGDNMRRCQSTGRWSGSVPVCQPVSCGPPPAVRFASAHAQHHTFNSVVTYSCNAGYELQGLNSAKCLASASWSDVYSQCFPVSCGFPPTLQNGNYHGIDYTFGQTVHYYCHPGYILQGSSLRHCIANGHWNGTSPRCSPIQCGSPAPIVSGEVMGNEWSLGNSVFYVCYAGYTINGNSSRTCQANGEWSGRTPHCEPISCGPPPVIPRSFISGANYNFGEYVVYVCQDGYFLIGNSVRQCQSDGTWSGGNLTCSPVVCAQPIPPSQGDVSSYDNSYGSRAYFSCDEGYVLEGHSHRVCLASGEWSGHMPRCEPVECGQPPAVSSAVSLTSDNRKISPSHRFYFHDSIKYLCQQGYRLEGDPVIQCDSGGAWTQPPVCEALSCNAVASIAHGYVSAPSLKVNASVMYGCQAGYELRGQAASLCQPDQTWNNPPPVCQPVSCGTPYPLDNGYVDGHSYLVYNSVVSYKCINGYVLVGNNTSRCQADKTWTTFDATCEPVECGPPPDVPNAVMSAASGQHYGIRVTYTCEEDFKLIGPSEVMCASNGRWQGTPRCEENKFEDFQQAVCILPCLHGGTCIAPYQCKCPPGYSGTRCEIELCRGRCLINGRCYGRNRCRCGPGRADSCERRQRPGYYS